MTISLVLFSARHCLFPARFRLAYYRALLRLPSFLCVSLSLHPLVSGFLLLVVFLPGPPLFFLFPTTPFLAGLSPTLRVPFRPRLHPRVHPSTITARRVSPTPPSFLSATIARKVVVVCPSFREALSFFPDVCVSSTAKRSRRRRRRLGPRRSGKNEYRYHARRGREYRRKSRDHPGSHNGDRRASVQSLMVGRVYLFVRQPPVPGPRGSR